MYGDLMEKKYVWNNYIFLRNEIVIFLKKNI